MPGRLARALDQRLRRRRRWSDDAHLRAAGAQDADELAGVDAVDAGDAVRSRNAAATACERQLEGSVHSAAHHQPGGLRPRRLLVVGLTPTLPISGSPSW